MPGSRWCGRHRTPAAIRVLADATFAIYLIHLFFIYAAEGIVTPAAKEFDVVVIAAYWSAGLVGSLAVIGLVRELLGPRSRDVIGA